jgi:hypothetical protein
MSEDDTEPELGEGDAGLDDDEAGVEEGWVAGGEVGPGVGVSYCMSAAGLSVGYPEEVLSTGEEEGAYETME